MVRIIVVLLNTAAMETKVVIWLNFSTVIFTRLYGTCSFHLCLSCFDTVREKAAGWTPAKVSNLSMQVVTRRRCYVPFVSPPQMRNVPVAPGHILSFCFVFFLSTRVPVIVSLTQRPNAICQRPRLKPVCWLRVCGLSHLCSNAVSCPASLDINGFALAQAVTDHCLVNRAASLT